MALPRRADHTRVIFQKHDPTWGPDFSGSWPHSQAIYAYVDAHNDEGKPFKWTKTADEILAKVKRFGQRTVQVHGGPR